MCPFCERGPFKMLPVHTNKIHGVDKWELREMAGYTTTDPISSEEARMAMVAKSHPENLVKAREALASGRRKPRRTTAGTQKHRDTLIAWMTADPERASVARRAAGKRANSPDARARRLATLRAKLAADPKAKARIYAHLHTPENRAKAIAAAVKANRRPVPEHGDLNRYKHHGCRCEPCRETKRRDRERTAANEAD